MKKNLVRIVALLLVAMLALTLIPMGALALTVNVESEAYEKYPTFDEWNSYQGLEWTWSEAPVTGNTSVTIKTNNYESFVVMPDGSKYDLQGIADWVKADAGDGDDKMSVTSSLKVNDAYIQKWGNMVWLVYAPHEHKLTGWISDGTTHWKNCTVCRKQLIHQNWCQDGDEDRICNVCGGDVPYHDIKVIETEGATITLNRDNASHRTKITADVEAKDGYEVGKLHFVKVRDDGSKQEITRYKKDGQFFTYMPTYEMEVSVDVTKK